MSNHYYSEKPQVDHDERNITAHFFDQEFKFHTDAGVFSKKQVDFGSALLINTVTLDGKSKLLDLGCGYGSIGIMLASQLSDGFVTMVDINERAVVLAKRNLETNRQRISKEVEVNIFQSDGFTNIKDQKFDLILFNPPIRAGKALIYDLFDKSFQYLEKDGELWIVIQKKQGALSAFAKLETIFTSVEEMNKDKGYYILKCKV